MSGIVGSRLNIRGSGLVGSLGTDGQVFTSAGAGAGAIFEAGGGYVTGYGQSFANPGGQWSKPSFGTGSAPSLTYTKLKADTTLFVYWTGGCSIFKGGSADGLVNASAQFKEDGSVISSAATVTTENTVGDEGGSCDFRGLYARTGLGTGDVVYQVEFRNDDGDWALYNLGSMITVWEI